MNLSKESLKQLHSKLVQMLADAMLSGSDTSLIQEKLKSVETELGLNESLNRRILGD
jgi:hypothetical protein